MSTANCFCQQLETLVVSFIPWSTARFVCHQLEYVFSNSGDRSSKPRVRCQRLKSVANSHIFVNRWSLLSSSRTVSQRPAAVLKPPDFLVNTRRPLSAIASIVNSYMSLSTSGIGWAEPIDNSHILTADGKLTTDDETYMIDG